MSTTFFTIFSSPRSGSNYLCSLLNSHPRISCHNEIFHQNEVGVYLAHLEKEDAIYDITQRNGNPHAFIKRMLDETLICSLPDVDVIGCKLLLNKYQIDIGLDAILAFKPLIIFLTRENKLAIYSSSFIAHETGIWMTEKVSKQHKIIFNESDYRELLKTQASFELDVIAKIKKQGINFLPIVYENLKTSTTITRILDFLNLPYCKLFSNIIKQNSKKLLNRFKNPEEVKAFAKSINKLSWLAE